MKNSIRFLSLSALLVSSTSIFAATALQPVTAVSTEQLVAPKVVKVVPPLHIPAAYNNLVVNVRFTLDRFGNVRHVKAVGDVPTEVADPLLKAVNQWQFTPCRDASGHGVQREVQLPIKLTDLGA